MKTNAASRREGTERSSRTQNPSVAMPLHLGTVARRYRPEPITAVEVERMVQGGKIKDAIKVATLGLLRFKGLL